MLYGLKPEDPITLAGAVAGLSAVAASLLPNREQLFRLGPRLWKNHRISFPQSRIFRLRDAVNGFHKVEAC